MIKKNTVNAEIVGECTPAEAQFAANVVAGMSYIAAYMEIRGNKTEKPTHTHYKNASEYAAKPAVMAQIAKLQAQASENAVWTRIDALRRLLRIADEAANATYEPLYDGDGQQIGVKYNPAAAAVELRATEQAAKMCGFNAPDEISHDVTVRISDELAEYTV